MVFTDLDERVGAIIVGLILIWRVEKADNDSRGV